MSDLMNDTSVAIERETDRVNAFSDGVFAIAITLLVLTIQVPRGASGHLAEALLQSSPVYVAYVISFAFILIMWINHHNVFRSIYRIDHTLLLLNGLLLMFVTLVPFPTSLLAQYLGTHDAPVAAAIYNGLFFIIAVAFNVLWFYVSRRPRLLAARADKVLMRGIKGRYRVGPLLYLIALGLAFISVPASLALNGALAIFYALPQPPVPTEGRPAA